MKKTNLRKKRAFALLISLFIMGFMVLLVLTLSAIVQVELKSSKQVIKNQQAKNAAKLAAFQALAEIQKSLGADQRISANASILDTEINENFETLEDDDAYAFWSYDFDFTREEVETIDNISHPHWLGVWDSTPGLHPVARSYDESKEDHSERILAYATNFLVSGNTSILRNSYLVEDELSLEYSPRDELTEDYINMLRKNSIADENDEYDSETMSVKVPLVTLKKTDSMEKRTFLETRIAWWVSDESQKAPLDIASEDEFSIASEDDKEQILQALPYKNGMQALSLRESDSYTAIFDVDLNEEEDREYVRSINDLTQLDLLKNSTLTASPSKMFYNSIATYSRALAVNVREGGLKKDLSVGLLSLSPDTLEYNPNYFSRPIGVEGFDSYFFNEEDKYNTISNSLYTDGKGHMFGPQAAGNMNLGFIDGINYTLNDASSTITQEIHKDPGGPLWDSLRNYYNNRVTKEGVDIYDSKTGYANKIKVNTDLSTGLSPVLQNYQLFIYPCLTSYGDGDYGVRIYMIPIVVLWNPYDIDIAAGSTFAFKHGNGNLNTIGNFRIAIGIKDTSDKTFKCLRDTRTEKIPRPILNTSNYDENLVSGSVEKSEISKDINFYRAVSFSDEEDSRFISASDDGTGTSKINKSFFGYGNWTEYHAEELVDEVENNETNPYFPKLVDFDSVSSADSVPSALTKGGLIRIYEEGDVETVQGVDMPTYYKLSPDSFYYRKLYFNNLRYSLGWTGQIALSVGGGVSALSESNRLDLMEEYSDQSLRFLVHTTEALKGGEARVFTLKSSVPYHYKWGGEDGYAGNFGKAMTNEWYLTEGVENDSIGGFFVDMIHPESAHTASTNDFGTQGTPDYDYDTYKGQVFDPMNTDTHDGKAIAVLFNLNEEDRQVVYDDRDHAAEVTGEATKLTLSIDDICLDFGNMNQYLTTLSDFRLLSGPIGYVRPDASFNRNPFIQTVYSTSSLVAQKGGGSALVYDELVMWNYEDDNDNTKLLLYQQEEPADEVESEDQELVEEELESNNTFIVDINADGSGYIATNTTMEFQSLKRYSFQRTEGSFHQFGAGTLSFPDSWHTEGTDSYCYFTSLDGYDYLRTTLAGVDQTGGKTLYINESPSYIFTSVSTTVDGEEAYGISRHYSLDRPVSSYIKLVDKRKSVLRVNAPPVASSYGETLYDVYYKNLMQEINYRIILDNVSDAISITNNGKVSSVIYNGVIYTNYDSLCAALSNKDALPSGLYTDDDYESFLTEIGLDSTYRDACWAWEDPYFLLRDARRISNPLWSSIPWESYSSPNTIEQDDRQAWRDQVPLSFNAKVVVEAADDRSLTITELMTKDEDGNVALVMTEGINAYRPVTTEMDPYNEWQFQYVFKFPWISQTSVSAKNFGDGRFGNAGNLRDVSYGTDSTRGTHQNSPQAFACWFARGDNLTAHTFFGSSTEGYQGNSLMTNLLDYYVNYEINSKKVQIGPDVMSEDGYSYNLKHFLRDYEAVTSPADLATANLIFGAEQSRNRGVGLGTADIIYPNYTMGSSYANMKIAPERNYDYDWVDSYSFLSTNDYVSLYGGYSAEREDKEIRRIRYDIAWLLNDLLWDEYFFSTLAYREAEQNDIDDALGYLAPKNPRVEYINTAKEIVYTRANINDDISSLNNIVENIDNLDYDFESNASRFWIKGAFNVNSTNIDAWKMVLGTSFGNKIYAYDSSENEDSDTAPFPRNGLPYTGKEFRESNVRGEEETAMQGYRALNRSELEELALSVVENIKDRGPFFSLADFVNRAVELRSMETRRMATEYGYNIYDFTNEIWDDTESEAETIKENANEAVTGEFYLKQNHMQKGVLQSAIDLTGINQAFFDTAYLIDYEDSLASLNARFATMDEAPDRAYAIVTKSKPSRYYTPAYQLAFWQAFGNPRNVWENYKATLGSTIAGAPAYLTQVDILKQIGSFITVRGDTFKIRAYGEIRNPMTEEVESKAWCEMLVQRYPEYINALSNAPTDINNRERELGYQSGRAEYDSLVEHLEATPVNKYLGRRFKIMSFKWLSEREI